MNYICKCKKIDLTKKNIVIGKIDQLLLMRRVY